MPSGWIRSAPPTLPAMVAQALFLTSRRHVDLRRVGAAACRRPG
ncbi:putative leader peptide [Streptomyces sp. NBC_00663]